MKIEEVITDVGLLRYDLQNLHGQVREVGDRVSHLEDATKPTTVKVAELEKIANSWVQMVGTQISGPPPPPPPSRSSTASILAKILSSKDQDAALQL